MNIVTADRWRSIAALRALRRGAGRVVAAARRLARGGAGRPGLKDAARWLFHRSLRVLLMLPGVRRGAKRVRAVLPGPVEWFVVRFRAYERRARQQRPAPSASLEALKAALAADQVASLDLSEDELRLYRRFATTGIAGPAARAARMSKRPQKYAGKP